MYNNNNINNIILKNIFLLHLKFFNKKRAISSIFCDYYLKVMDSCQEPFRVGLVDKIDQEYPYCKLEPRGFCTN